MNTPEHHLSPHINNHQTEEYKISQQDDRLPPFHTKALKFVGSSMPCWAIWWCNLLRHCATRQKVVGSDPDEATEIFHCLHLSGHTMALGLTQPPKEISTSDTSWETKVASVYSWQPCHIHVLSRNPGSLNVQACTGIALLLPWLWIRQGGANCMATQVSWLNSTRFHTVGTYKTHGILPTFAKKFKLQDCKCSCKWHIWHSTSHLSCNSWMP
jgi:hypothetical protein